MRAVRFSEHGGPDVLDVAEFGRPKADPDEVVIEVAAAGVNPVDTYYREGSYEPYDLPMVPGVDAAGVVAGTGSKVDGIAEDDHVFATGLGQDGPGGYAEYVVAPADRVAVLDDGIDLVAAGGAGVAAVTAWRALVDHAALRPAESVLVHGGSGGVGHAAVQIAAAAGARVVTTAAPEYHDRVADLGADAVLDYGRSDLASAVRDAAGGGVDVVLDHRLDDYLGFDAEVAATGARVVGIGERESAIGIENSPGARAKDFQLTLMSMFNTPRLADPLESVARLWADGAFEIEVARSYELVDAPTAQRDVLSESFLGKLVLEP
ncbi:alcohol dehydrogenase catalytic domain-containing protein [Candidatus Halobonum tyrrellensis]|uniref:Zn-dependent oxidoreductase, NADPH:quinone reductase n=1 Tax=Candidatus Halobonum tyrrellensis G22 TaxID=1324957 RepID=V4HKL9_9EURY|nr:zinc-binding dehydrogenase [Candidatus Halobonum tyrrellensis]ESP88469.1 Zn-dependent oxidoreductase, NADPH:quinone reductase [Candidatus Halobonum tyrrellensis G22]